MVFGFLRLILGVSFGIVIFLLAKLLYLDLLGDMPGKGVFTYLAVYVPVRWVEWSIIAVGLEQSSRKLSSFLFGAHRDSRIWRAGGIAISCFADVPVIMLAGVVPNIPRGFIC